MSIRKEQSGNNIGSTLENATLSFTQQNQTNQFILCVLCIGNKKVLLPHYYLYQVNVLTSLIHTVETHMVYQLTVEHLS